MSESEFWESLDILGEDQVRINLSKGIYGTKKQLQAQEWLRQKEHARNRQTEENKEAYSKQSLTMAASQSRASWINAYSMLAAAVIALLTLIVSTYAVLRVEGNVPRYAIVGKDGRLLSQRNFGKYGLFVKWVKSAEKSDDRHTTKAPVPSYIIRFDFEPDYFEISTRERAVPEILQSGPKEYTVRFVEAGFGDPFVECNFKIEAY